MDLKKIFNYLPEVTKPTEKKLGFKVKLKWTLIVLVAFFILANIPLYGLSSNALSRFQFLAIVLGTDFGSIISLGVGPIVMASIILQLLVGAGIMNIDTNDPEGRKFFQGLQGLLVIVFIFFEALVYVLMGGLQAVPGYTWIVTLQLVLGGFSIMLMDDVTTKWGFGSGVSLFIGAGVSWRIVTGLLQIVDQQGRSCLGSNFATVSCPGKLFAIIQAIINQNISEALLAIATITATIIIFLIVVWAQSLKVEVPLSFGRIRGYSVKWPLSFFYTSVIPVILTAALVANVQLFAGLIENAAKPCLPEFANQGLGVCTAGAKFAVHFLFLGRFDQGQAVSGLSFWVGQTNLLDLAIRGGGVIPVRYLIQGLTHVLFFTFLAVIFAIFWVKTSGMDAYSQAQKIIGSGLQISGFRQDERVLEAVLKRYIMPLTVMGGIAIGLLASITDLLGALVSGTAILLVIMIMYQFYQSIAQQHAVDMHPALRKFIK